MIKNEMWKPFCNYQYHNCINTFTENCAIAISSENQYPTTSSYDSVNSNIDNHRWTSRFVQFNFLDSF